MTKSTAEIIEKHPSSTIVDQRTYLFMDEISNETIKPVIEFILDKNIYTKHKIKRSEHLNLIISSPGGDMSSAFALIDVILGSEIPVHTFGIGEVSSCALMIFMAGSKGNRSIGPNSSVMSHQWSYEPSGKSYELASAHKDMELTNNRMLEHYKKCTGLDENVIKEKLLTQHDVFLLPEEVIHYGIADKIEYLRIY